MAGKYFEEFENGDRYESAWRYISESDLRRFVDLTGLSEPLFTSQQYVTENTEYDGWIVPGYLTMCYSLGLFMDSGWLDEGIAYLGAEELAFDAPVHVGDEIRAIVDVTGLQKTNSGENGVVTFEWRVESTAHDRVMSLVSRHLVKRGGE